MQQSNLIKLIRKLSPSQRKQLRNWLNSPFFNLRKEVVELYSYIDKHVDTSLVPLQKETTWQSLFAPTLYNSAQINRLMSMLLQSIKNYLSYTEWQSNLYDTRMNTYKALRRLDMPFESLDKELQELQQLLEEQPQRGAQHFYLQHELLSEQLELRSLHKREISNITTEQMNTLEMVFALHSLSFYCANFNNPIVRAKNSATKSMLNLVVEQLTIRPIDHILIEIHLLQKQCLEDTATEDAYPLLLNKILENMSLFSQKELRVQFLLCINYCIKQHNHGNQAFLKEAFRLYQLGLEYKVLLENGMITKFTYRNIVLAGLGVGEYDWVIDYIEAYKLLLPKKDREAAYQFNLATYYFRLPNYDIAMQLLRQGNFGDDTIMQLAARTMLLRIYVEKEYAESAISLLDSFYTFLSRKKNLGYQRDHFANFIRFTRRLIFLLPGDTTAFDSLQRDIEQTSLLAEKPWLLERLKLKK